MNNTTHVCPACSSEQTYPLLKWQQYTIHRCRDCQLRFITPLPTDEELFKFYQGFLYRPPDLDKIRPLIEVRKQELRARFAPESAYWSGKKFLDYGGGTGTAYAAARELNLEVYYQDLDQQAQAFVKQHFGLEDSFIIERLALSDQRFDFIFSDNVIEHVKQPVIYLREIRNALEKNGMAVIKTPHGGNTEILFFPLISLRDYAMRGLKYNSAATVIRAFLSRFWHCDPPRHLYSFTKGSLEAMAYTAGFKASEVSIEYYNLPVFKYSLAEIFFNFKQYRSLKSMIIRIFMLPLLLVELVSKFILLLFRSIGLLSPAGIILKLKK